MKKLFEKMKSYSFWLSFSGALICFLSCLGKIFDFEIQDEVVENLILAFAGVLVVLGLVTKDNGVTDTSEENVSETKENLGEEKQENESESDTDLGE